MIFMLILLRLGGVLLRRRQGGPWAPPPSSEQVPGDVDGSFICFMVLVLSFFDCIAFLSLGLVYCMVFEPFKPRPVFGFCMCPFSSLLSGCFRRRRVSSSLLFLSGAGETQTPFGGFGVPLVFLRAGRDRPLRSVHLPLHLHQGHRPHLFFFSRRSFSGLGVFWFFVIVVVGFLAVSMVLLWVVACKTILLHLGGVGRQDISRPLGPLLSLLILGLGENQCPAEIYAQFSAELVSPPLPPSCRTL